MSTPALDCRTALDPAQPHAAGIRAFEDLSSRRVLKVEFTAREREIAALLINGPTSQRIGQQLAISPRTVDVYRAQLMRKTGSATTAELVNKLLSDPSGPVPRNQGEAQVNPHGYCRGNGQDPCHRHPSVRPAHRQGAAVNANSWEPPDEHSEMDLGGHHGCRLGRLRR